MLKTLSVLTAFLCVATTLDAQTQPNPALQSSVTVGRPIPGPVFEIPGFTRAVQRGMRTRSGVPGPNYFVSRARYDIHASFDARANRLTGSETIVYHNNSPDTLNRLALHLFQNAFAPGAPRRQPAPVTGGMTLSKVSVRGVTLHAANNRSDAVPIVDSQHRRIAESGYFFDNTVLWVSLDKPLAAHDSIVLAFDWSYAPAPAPSDGRQGREGNVAFIGYWYPQMVVYDDVNGWVADPFLLEAEFYMEPADYDVTLTVPHGWVVDATGTLQNPNEVLSARTRQRLADAHRTGDVVRVLTPGADASAALGASSTWHFTTHDMRDFAWGTSDEWAWDATRAIVNHSDTVAINSFFRLTAKAAAWKIGGARFTRDAIERMSEYLWPYPWPKMTSMEGVLDSGGMEYPMMTIMQPWDDTMHLAGDLMHETGHMWFPMQVGGSETRYPWMDEGFNSFDVAQAMTAQYGKDFKGGRPNDFEAGQRAIYVGAARRGNDLTMMWPGDLYPQDWYFVMFYSKTAQVMSALRGVLGDSVFHAAYREYGRRWIGKHPYPYDFFNTFADVTGKDLSWFWQSWIYNGWPLDQAIGKVDNGNVTIEDRGLAIMPVKLALTHASGAVERVDVPVDVWLTGARTYTMHVADDVVKIEIDPDALFPDIDRSNQTWRK